MSDAMEDGSSSGEELERAIREAEDKTDSIPWDHTDGPVPPHMLRPAGPPPPQPIFGSVSAGPTADTVDCDTPADNCDAGSDKHPWPMLESHENGEVVSDWIQGPHLPDGRFERSPTESASLSGSDEQDAESEEASEADGSNQSHESWTWSDTTLILEGEDLQEAREYLISQYRLELRDTQPAMTSRVLGGKVAAFRRKVNRTCWFYVSELAESKLTGDRLARWQDFKYSATHNRIPRRWKRESAG